MSIRTSINRINRLNNIEPAPAASPGLKRILGCVFYLKYVYIHNNDHFGSRTHSLYVIIFGKHVAFQTINEPVKKQKF